MAANLQACTLFCLTPAASCHDKLSRSRLQPGDTIRAMYLRERWLANGLCQVDPPSMVLDHPQVQRLLTQRANGLTWLCQVAWNCAIHVLQELISKAMSQRAAACVHGNLCKRLIAVDAGTDLTHGDCVHRQQVLHLSGNLRTSFLSCCHGMWYTGVRAAWYSGWHCGAQWEAWTCCSSAEE